MHQQRIGDRRRYVHHVTGCTPCGPKGHTMRRTLERMEKDMATLIGLALLGLLLLAMFS